MKGKSPFDFDISVTADKKRRARARGMSGAVETSSRGCEHPGCDKPGKYRAPKSPDNLDEFLWFCLEHVRAYNLKWNFFENHSEAELERQFAADKVWERPTRPFKKGPDGHPEGRAWQRFGFDDPLEVLGDKGTVNGAARAATPKRRLPAPERKALVKVLHPDMNGGKRDDEERLAEVVWAWDQVKDSRSFGD